MYDMSSKFWYALSLISLICGIGALIGSWYFDVKHSRLEHGLLVGISFGGFLGANYMRQLGNWSKSKKNHSES